jgi:pseudomonalisin
MRRLCADLFLSALKSQVRSGSLVSRCTRTALLLLLLAASTGAMSNAQTKDRATASLAAAQLVALPNHHPLWATSENSTGLLPAGQEVDHLTLVLSRSLVQETAFQKFLANQQDPASPDYHRWLTPTQIGERFGLPQDDIAAITGWIASQGLHVNWISPSRIFISIGGTSASVAQAFHTELHSYRVNGLERMSVSSDPMIPSALASSIKAIHGLYTVEDRPFHLVNTTASDSPDMNSNSGAHYLVPADFATIYDVPGNLTGTGQTIGIVGRSRTDFADFANFRLKTDSYFPDPTEIVPTAFGGVDPGPPLTAPPTGTVSTGDQSEATLDVTRAGSIAPTAQLLLVVATGASGGIETDAQYLVQTTPVPAQIMTISFGACETSGGAAGVNFWDALFQQAAAEGISSFVSSGDSGASGCDKAFATPPANPNANSPNYICSSSYATCVGGTEFNDTSDPSTYWSSTNNSSDLGSALSYIPEGGWNEPLDSNSKPIVASSGGGVSSIIATPSWQTGTGVPAAKAGRYTPDVSFSAAGHDGYFACLAFSGGDCVDASDGSYHFIYFSGTSAAAPSMAAVAALLNQKLGIAQGNLNPEIYQLSASTPLAFHDTTVSSSGVENCAPTTPSMCNNSIPSPSGLSGGQSGYSINAGYDEVTGLGSLDVANFLNSYTGVKTTPTVTVSLNSAAITTAQPLYVTVTVSGVAGVPTGSVSLTGPHYSASAVSTGGGGAGFTIAADILPPGTDVLTATYTPDAASASAYNTSTGTASVTVTSIPKITPTLSVLLSLNTITTAQLLSVELSVSGGAENQSPSGTVVLKSGSYTSAPATLSADLARITVPAETLAVGTDTLTAIYTPDATSSPIYNNASGTASVTVTAAVPVAPSVQVMPNPNSVTTAQALSVQVLVGNTLGFGYQTPTGSVTLSSGSYTSPATSLANGSATFSIAAGTLPVGSDTLTATYTPDTAGSAAYIGAAGTASITVTVPPTPAIAISSTPVTVRAGATTGNKSTITITASGGFTGSVALTATITSSPAGAQGPPTLSFGSTSPVLIGGSPTATATLSIFTTASTSAALAVPAIHRTPWYAAGGATLACLLFCGMPARRRRWRTMLGMAALLIFFAGSMLACGGGGGGGTVTPIIAGTTPGNYTVTVTGTSGATTANGTFTLTVQ